MRLKARQTSQPAQPVAPSPAKPVGSKERTFDSTFVLALRKPRKKAKGWHSPTQENQFPGAHR